MTTTSNNFDERLERLVVVIEQQAETSRQQSDDIRQIVEATRQQADSIRSLARAFSKQARAYREFSRELPEILETTRRASQASEGATFMAQRTLEAIRDLIEDLREERGNNF